MQNETFFTILNDVHNALVAKYTLEDEIDAAKVIDFLHEIAKNLQESDFSTPTNFLNQADSFEEEYKALALSSIKSYKTSNSHISNIANEIEDEDISIKPEEIIEHFREIQSHLSSEMDKANQTITALVSQVKELELKSNADPLTKVYNRRAMDKYLAKLCAQNSISQTALLILDIDDFKIVNDTFGHVAGDKVLIFLSRLLKSTLRGNDKLFRFGGEEFLLILHGTHEKKCLAVAERILELTRANKLLYKDKQIQVTVSMGLTGLKSNDTPESAITRADKALYEAKQSGKDQIRIIE